MVTTYDAQGNPIAEQPQEATQQGYNEYKSKVPSQEEFNKAVKKKNIFSSIQGAINKLTPAPTKSDNYLAHLKQKYYDAQNKKKVEEKYKKWEQSRPENKKAIQYASKQFQAEEKEETEAIAYAQKPSTRIKQYILDQARGTGIKKFLEGKNITYVDKKGIVRTRHTQGFEERINPRRLAGSAEGARKIEKGYSHMRKASQGMGNYLFPMAGVKQDYNKDEIRQIKAQLAFMRLQRMKQKMQRQMQPRRRARAMPRNIQNMPAGLRNYYYNLQQSQQGQTQSINSSARGRRSFAGANPAPSQISQYYDGQVYRPQPQQTQHIETSFFNSNRKVLVTKKTQPEKFMAYRTPQRRGKIGCRYSDEKENW